GEVLHGGALLRARQRVVPERVAEIHGALDRDTVAQQPSLVTESGTERRRGARGRGDRGGEQQEQRKERTQAHGTPRGVEWNAAGQPGPIGQTPAVHGSRTIRLRSRFPPACSWIQ